MNVIHKTVIPIAPEVVLALPIGASLLDCQDQAGDLALWYSFNLAYSLEPAEEVTFYVVGTGQELPDTFPGKYFKTVAIGGDVWHIYFKPLPPLPATRKPIVVDPNGPGAEHHRGAH